MQGDESQAGSTVNLNKHFNIPKYKRNITRTSMDCLSFTKLNNSINQNESSSSFNHLNDNFDK